MSLQRSCYPVMVRDDFTLLLAFQPQWFITKDTTRAKVQETQTTLNWTLNQCSVIPSLGAMNWKEFQRLNLHPDKLWFLWFPRLQTPDLLVTCWRCRYGLTVELSGQIDDNIEALLVYKTMLDVVYCTCKSLQYEEDILKVS